MNCLSINAKGIRVEVKTNWVRRLKHLHKANFIGIQEIQLQEFEKVEIQDCWGNQEYDYDGVDATERSGGLISIWNSRCLKKEVIKARNYLIIIGEWIGIVGDTIITNIYRPHNLCEQRRLCAELFDIKSLNP